MPKSTGKLRAIINEHNSDGTIAVRTLVSDKRLDPRDDHWDRVDVWVKRDQTRDGG